MPLGHERRRRRFLDDTPDVSSGESRHAGPLAGGAAGVVGSPEKSYTDAAKLARQRAICTLLPARMLTIALAVGACLTMVGACLSLHVGSPAPASLVPAEDVAFLRLDAPGSIGDWLASTLLVVAGVLAVFIYSLRRHRIDDYHGRYRVWIWIMAVCLVASLAETTGLGRLARAICRLAADWSRVRNDVLWPATVSLVAAAMGLRLFFEIRKCRWAVAALAATGLGFLVAAAAGRDWPTPWTETGKPLLARGSWLAGYVFVLATFLLYARHVQLDVTGSLSVRVKRRRPAVKSPPGDDNQSEPSEPPAKPALRLRTDLDPVESSSVGASRSQAVADSHAPDTARANAAISIPQKSTNHLSKTERRRLRREARESRMAS